MNPVIGGGVYVNNPPHPESRIAVTAMAAIAIPLELVTCGFLSLGADHSIPGFGRKD